MRQIIDGKLYDTEKAAECIADNHFRDGSNRLSRGRGKSLYRTNKGTFFEFYETQWQGEQDYIEPLSIERAKSLFEELRGNPDNWPAEFGEPEEA